MTTRKPATAGDDQPEAPIRPDLGTKPKPSPKASRWRKKPTAEALRRAMEAQRPLDRG